MLPPCTWLPMARVRLAEPWRRKRSGCCGGGEGRLCGTGGGKWEVACCTEVAGGRGHAPAG